MHVFNLPKKMTVPFNLSRRVCACLAILFSIGALSSLSAQYEFSDLAFTEVYSFDSDGKGPQDLTNGSFFGLSQMGPGSGVIKVEYTLSFDDGNGGDANVGNAYTSFSFDFGVSEGVILIDGNDVTLTLDQGSSKTLSYDFDSVLGGGDSVSITAFMSSSSGVGNYDSYSLWIGDTQLGALTNGSSSFASVDKFYVTANGLQGGETFTYSDLVISAATVIPEPSTWALSIGFLAIGGFIYRRRRS